MNDYKPKVIKSLYDPTKNPRQMEAHSALEENILYGGAKGGGKTAWLINEALRLSFTYPGNRGWIGCKFLTDFRDNALKQLDKFIPSSIIREHRKVEGYYTLQWTEYVDEFFTGKVISRAPKDKVFTSTIMYGGLGNDDEAYQTINNMPELGWFGIDQAEQISERQFQLLHGQLRLNLPNIKYKALLTANPEPGWLRDRFIENCYPDHRFIPALPRDNPFLPSDYEERLRDVFPEEMARRLIEGDWDVETEGNYLIPYSRIRAAINKGDKAKLTFNDIYERVMSPGGIIESPPEEPKGKKVAGVDISRYGEDETVFLLRQGNKVLHIESWSHQDTTFSAGRIARIIRDRQPDIVNVDSIGIGAGVFDLLRNEGFPVKEINVGEAALDKERYANKRAEYYSLLAKKFEKGEIDIPDNSKLASQLASLKYKYDTKSRLLIESKEQMRKEGRKSPDYADALMLAFIGSDVKNTAFEPVSTLHFSRFNRGGDPSVVQRWMGI